MRRKVGSRNQTYHIAGVQHIGTGRRHRDLDDLLVLLIGDGSVGHLAEQLAQLLGRLLQAAALVKVVNLDVHDTGVQAGGDAGGAVVLRDNLDGLDGEGLIAVLGEHGDHDVADNVELGLVGGGDLDEDVLGVERDLGVVAVDDGRQGADGLVGVEDDGVDGLVADDVQVAAEVLVGLVELHQLLAVHLLGLVEGHEADVLGGLGLVREGALDGVEIVGADGDKGSLAGQVLVQLVLQADEGLVSLGGELDVAQDGAGDVGADLLAVGADGDLLHLVLGDVEQLEVGGGGLAAEDVQVHGDALEAEHVVAVGGDLDGQLGRLVLGARLILLGVLVELDAELEAELLEGVGSEAVCIVVGAKGARVRVSGCDQAKSQKSKHHGGVTVVIIRTYCSPSSSKRRYLSTLMVGILG